MSEPLLFAIPEPPALPLPPIEKRTEREVLDMLVKRYTKVTQNGNSAVNRYVYAEHVRNKAGFDASRTADFIAMDTWPGWPHGSKLALHGHEVKVSRSDWLTELKDPEKAEAFKPYMDHWWLVVGDRRIVKDEELPTGWGLMYAAGTRLRVAVPAPRLSPPDLPKTMLASLLRAVAKTAARSPSVPSSEGEQE